MKAEFEIDGAIVRVVTLPGANPTQVSLTIERPDNSTHLYLPQSMARAIGSTLTGAASELKAR